MRIFFAAPGACVQPQWWALDTVTLPCIEVDHRTRPSSHSYGWCKQRLNCRLVHPTAATSCRSRVSTSFLPTPIIPFSACCLQYTGILPLSIVKLGYFLHESCKQRFLHTSTMPPSACSLQSVLAAPGASFSHEVVGLAHGRNGLLHRSTRAYMKCEFKILAPRARDGSTQRCRCCLVLVCGTRTVSRIAVSAVVDDQS